MRRDDCRAVQLDFDGGNAGPRAGVFVIMQIVLGVRGKSADRRGNGAVPERLWINTACFPCGMMPLSANRTGAIRDRVDSASCQITSVQPVIGVFGPGGVFASPGFSPL